MLRFYSLSNLNVAISSISDLCIFYGYGPLFEGYSIVMRKVDVINIISEEVEIRIVFSLSLDMKIFSFTILLVLLISK